MRKLDLGQRAPVEAKAELVTVRSTELVSARSCSELPLLQSADAVHDSTRGRDEGRAQGQSIGGLARRWRPPSENA
jgi:hypothetical protein